MKSKHLWLVVFLALTSQPAQGEDLKEQPHKKGKIGTLEVMVTPLRAVELELQTPQKSALVFPQFSNSENLQFGEVGDLIKAGGGHGIELFNLWLEEGNQLDWGDILWTRSGDLEIEHLFHVGLLDCNERDTARPHFGRAFVEKIDS